jgi:hypothetical protein
VILNPRGHAAGIFCFRFSLSFRFQFHHTKIDKIMNKNFILGLLMGLCVLAVFAFRPAESRPTTVATPKWKYLQLGPQSPSVWQGKMDGLGGLGWELVAIDPKGNYVFKYPAVQ